MISKLEVSRAGLSPQRFAFELLRCMITTPTCVDCPAVRTILASKIATIARAIDDNIEEWGDFDLLHNPQLAFKNGAGNITRHDFDAKRVAIDDALKDKRFKTHMDAVKSFASNTASREFAEAAISIHRAAVRLSFPKPCTLSFAVDAAEIGRPSKDLLFILQANCKDPGFATVPAPQERLLINDPTISSYNNAILAATGLWNETHHYD